MKLPYALEIVAGTAIALHAMTASSHEDLDAPVQLSKAARVTIGEAIAIAEEHAGGEAVEAELDRKGGQSVYDVDVQTAAGDMEVLIDAASGAIISMEPDD